MKISKTSLFLRLSGFAQGIIVFIAIAIFINIVSTLLGFENFIIPPENKFFLSARESHLTRAQWSVLEKVSLLIALVFLYLAFYKLNKFGALLKQKIIFERAQPVLLKKSALYFLVGLNVKTLLLNIVSAIDSLTSQSRVWNFDGSWFARLITTFLIFLFLYIISDILLKASELKAESELTI